jgi:hypothetical protein
MEQRRNFLATLTAENEGGFINLDLIRLVDQIRPGHIRVWFSEAHVVEFGGDGAGGILARLSERALTVDGTPLEGIGNVNLATPLMSQLRP